MSEIKTRADILIEAGNSIKMQDAMGIDPVVKIYGEEWPIRDCDFNIHDIQESTYEFPLAVVEGKPVFTGDELYNSDGYGSCIVDSTWDHKSKYWSNHSWNPPKPATVMVEILREDADVLANFYAKDMTGKFGRILEACRKAL